MNEQEQFWAGEFGEEYLARNRVNWLERVPFWTDILAKTGARSAFEVGCNFGPNLLAIRTVKPGMFACGIDVNASALQQAEALGISAYRGTVIDRPNATPLFDIVFSAGVLIHIAPKELNRTIKEIVALSSKYVLAIEYESDQEEEVNYRGHTERLWKRPYGKLYEDMGLKLIESGPAQGFDRCTYWLLEKQG